MGKFQYSLPDAKNIMGKFRNCISGGKKRINPKKTKTKKGGTPCNDAAKVVVTVNQLIEFIQTAKDPYDIVYKIDNLKNDYVNEDKKTTFDGLIRLLINTVRNSFSCEESIRYLIGMQEFFQHQRYIDILLQLLDHHIYVWLNIHNTDTNRFDTFITFFECHDIIDKTYLRNILSRYDQQTGPQRRQDMLAAVKSAVNTDYEKITGNSKSVAVLTEYRQLLHFDVKNSYIAKESIDPDSRKDLKISPIMMSDIDLEVGSADRPFLLLVEPVGKCGYVYEEPLFYTKTEIEQLIRNLPEDETEIISPISRAPVIAVVDVMKVNQNSNMYSNVIKAVAESEGGAIVDLRKQAKKLRVRLTKTIKGKRVPKTEKEIRRHVEQRQKK